MRPRELRGLRVAEEELEVEDVRGGAAELLREQREPGRVSRSATTRFTLSTRPVLVCIETKFCIQIRILQHFSNSTKFSI